MVSPIRTPTASPASKTAEAGTSQPSAEPKPSPKAAKPASMSTTGLAVRTAPARSNEGGQPAPRGPVPGQHQAAPLSPTDSDSESENPALLDNPLFSAEAGATSRPESSAQARGEPEYVLTVFSQPPTPTNSPVAADAGDEPEWHDALPDAGHTALEISAAPAGGAPAAQAGQSTASWAQKGLVAAAHVGQHLLVQGLPVLAAVAAGQAVKKTLEDSPQIAAALQVGAVALQLGLHVARHCREASVAPADADAVTRAFHGKSEAEWGVMPDREKTAARLSQRNHSAALTAYGVMGNVANACLALSGHHVLQATAATREAGALVVGVGREFLQGQVKLVHQSGPTTILNRQDAAKAAASFAALQTATMTVLGPSVAALGDDPNAFALGAVAGSAQGVREGVDAMVRNGLEARRAGTHQVVAPRWPNNLARAVDQGSSRTALLAGANAGIALAALATAKIDNAVAAGVVSGAASGLLVAAIYPSFAGSVQAAATRQAAAARERAGPRVDGPSVSDAV